jgi:hypothetical protein
MQCATAVTGGSLPKTMVMVMVCGSVGVPLLLNQP